MVSGTSSFSTSSVVKIIFVHKNADCRKNVFSEDNFPGLSRVDRRPNGGNKAAFQISPV